MRLAFDLVGSVEQIALPSGSGPHPISGGPLESKRQSNLLFASCLPTELGHNLSSSPALKLQFTPFAPLVLGPSDTDQIIWPTFLGLQSEVGDHEAPQLP